MPLASQSQLTRATRHNPDISNEFAVNHWKTAYEQTPHRTYQSSVDASDEIRGRQYSDDSVLDGDFTEGAKKRGPTRGQKMRQTASILPYEMTWIQQFNSGKSNISLDIIKLCDIFEMQSIRMGLLRTSSKCWQDMLHTNPQDGRIVGVLAQVLKGSRNHDHWWRLVIRAGTILMRRCLSDGPG